MAKRSIGGHKRTRARAAAAEAGRGQQSFRLLAEALEELMAAHSRGGVLGVLCKFARTLVGADGVTVVLREGEECFYARSDSPLGPLWEGQRFPLISCISGWAMLNCQTAIVPDVFVDPRIPHGVYRPTFVRSLVMVPLGRVQPSAAIGAYWANTRRPSDVEVSLLETLARAAGGALERCVSDERIRASEQRLRALFTNTVVGFGIATLDGRLVEANHRLVDILGYGAQELMEKSLFDFTHPADVPRNRELLSALIAGEISHFHLQKRYLNSAGCTVWVHNYVWLITDAAGAPTQLAAAVIDITREKEAQERLAQAQRLDSLGQLTGGIAHDFNNLLTVINGSAEVIAEQAKERHENLHELAKIVQSAGERAAALTRRLLSFARQQALDPVVIRLDEVLAGMEGMLRRVLGEDIEVKVKTSAPHCLTLVDQAQLESAVLNLCVNARDAMPRGGALTMETAEVAADAAARFPELPPGRRYIALSVSDTGVGMTTDVQDRAFEPFFSTKPKGAGTGLGLSMVYGFAKQSDGHVTMRSTPGKGTTVSLFLPASCDARAKAPLKREPAAAGRGEHILLVEDDDAVRRHVERSLTSLGYRVESASNADQALELLMLEKRYDLLLTDLVMPGRLDGVGLARAARQLDPGLRVLYTTGYADRRAELTQGEFAIDVLHKPYGRADLARKVKAALSASGTGSEPAMALPV
ncbi:PAS domain S-box protein [Noviherbaspirillum pedocola]|uniref:histidine kinase n=1 Tax=Noviherbaspirillum pedocola TaxID=2801341 RepID=A0A934W422_9BURK|nr:PAS domain S-box protein [Noviherbaspirillum pedocola]MBK4733437.1 PAS domain S-box protein [Noviherbaspirillum pedocola]